MCLPGAAIAEQLGIEDEAILEAGSPRSTKSVRLERIDRIGVVGRWFSSTRCSSETLERKASGGDDR